MQSKYSSIGNFFIKCETMNSTSKSKSVAANGCDLPTRSILNFRCRIWALCSITLNVRLLSCIIEFAYWSSDMQVSIKKHSFKLAMLDSFLLSCITIELKLRETHDNSTFCVQFIYESVYQY